MNTCTNETILWFAADPWRIFSAVYILLATLTFLPVLRTIFARVRLNDGGASFDKSPHFSEEGKLQLTQHYSRLQGTLGFWKTQAERFRRFHIYSLFWTLPASVLIPLLAQANAGRWALTLVSAHTALLLVFHSGLRVESNYKAFRHGESEFYDLYRRLLDAPSTFGKTEDSQIAKYVQETELIRRYVRAAETNNFPTLEEARSKLGNSKGSASSDGTSG